jgi:hypothetical protein
MGVPFAAGAADPELQALARRAQQGDERAQLELGIRYESGRGVLVDLDRAERLYLLAAIERGGTTYVADPRGGGAIPVSGESAAGLAEAGERLRALRLRRANGL